MAGSPQVAAATSKATTGSAAKKSSYAITAILVAINCFVFVFGEQQGHDREVIARFSSISRELATGYRLAVDAFGCVHDAIRPGLPNGDESSLVPNFPPIGGGPCSTQHDVGFVSAQMAGEFQYRSLSPWTTLFTSMFLHQSWMHLIGNMLFLVCFGSIVETNLGSGRFLALYIAAGLLSGLGAALIVWADPQLGLKAVAAIVPSVGASGAIAGVMGAYLALHPRDAVYIPVPVGSLVIPSKTSAWVGWLFAGLWGGWEVYTAYAAGPFSNGTNHLAHIAGFGAGVLLVVMRANAKGLLLAYWLFPAIWAIIRSLFINRYGM